MTRSIIMSDVSIRLCKRQVVLFCMRVEVYNNYTRFLSILTFAISKNQYKQTAVLFKSQFNKMAFRSKFLHNLWIARGSPAQLRLWIFHSPRKSKKTSKPLRLYISKALVEMRKLQQLRIMLFCTV